MFSDVFGRLLAIVDGVSPTAHTRFFFHFFWAQSRPKKMHETNVYAGRLSIFFAAAKRPQKKCMKRTNNAVVESFRGAEFRRVLDKATNSPSPYRQQDVCPLYSTT